MTTYMYFSELSFILPGRADTKFRKQLFIMCWDKNINLLTVLKIRDGII